MLTDSLSLQDCHQIRENHGKMRDFVENQGSFKFLIVSIQRSDFLYTHLCIHLSVIVTRFYPFIYHSVLCSHFEAVLL